MKRVIAPLALLTLVMASEWQLRQLWRWRRQRRGLERLVVRYNRGR